MMPVLNAAMSRTFSSLSVPNYRRFFFGQVISWTGTWVQWIAQGWLVLELTGSGLGLGLLIVRSIVERHGGTVRLERTEQGGTRAIVELLQDAPA